ncbi:hypothetical protein Q3G72_028928 [Acer saccharum]|nr:hypothetical protein Q3G72_028928 [Acer saccharum]
MKERKKRSNGAEGISVMFWLGMKRKLSLCGLFTKLKNPKNENAPQAAALLFFRSSARCSRISFSYCRCPPALRSSTAHAAALLRFLSVQQRRAQAYVKLKRGFSDYMVSGVELAYQQLCSEVTVEFNDCSKQVLEMESMFRNSDFCRADLAQLIRVVQTQEKQKLHLVCTVLSSSSLFKFVIG